MEAVGGLMVIFYIFLFVIAILWFILPFAIFGTKPRLDLLAVKQEVNNKLLKDVLIELRKLNENKQVEQKTIEKQESVEEK